MDLDAYRRRLEARIAANVEPDGDCLVWTGRVDDDGYGLVWATESVTGQPQNYRRVHRVVWALAHGPIPSDMQMLHSCDNPPCAKLSHLSLGTYNDNVQDKMEKGRWRGPPRPEFDVYMTGVKRHIERRSSNGGSLDIGTTPCQATDMTTAQQLTTENVHFGHVSEDTAYVVDDYPYSFRLRTSIRYWIETTKNGDRFVSQTLNPKTGRWNKPKKSTYAEVGVMYLDEQGHVTWTGVHHGARDEWVETFRTVTEGRLSDAQRRKLAAVIGLNRAMKKVTVSIHEGRMTDEEQAEQAQIHSAIARDAARHANAALREV